MLASNGDEAWCLMKILTAEEMAAADRAIGGGRRACARVDGERGDGCGAVLPCGGLRGMGLSLWFAVRGTMAGDGMVAARVLSEHGRRVRVALLGRADEVKGDAAAALACVPARVRKSGPGAPRSWNCLRWRMRRD